MIKRKGDLFNSTAPAIGHGVNCAGVMGAGIAKTFREKFPRNYKNYRAACLNRQLDPGQIAVNREGDLYIINMATQNMPGRDARYHWVFQAALTAAQQAVDNGIDRIAIPMIGCGIGGLEWKHVESLLKITEDIAGDNFNWEVWEYGS